MADLHSRSWTDAFPTGSEVECRWGAEWKRCVVVSRTRSGLPIVSLVGDRTAWTFRIDRKGDIRKEAAEALAKEGK
jgi:hypothetical protein